jgi:hypothetical protein
MSADTSKKGGNVSEDDGSLDQLVEAASVPNLAALFKRGKEAGLLQPVTGYSPTA